MPKNIRHQRVISRSNVKNYPKRTFDQACDIVINGKKMEGMQRADDSRLCERLVLFSKVDQ